MYNAPRAASIYAKSDDCVTWALDRETFNYIVKDASIKKREKYVGFLSKVDIFKTLDEYQIASIADAIKEEIIKEGENIINQGEKGDKFYILESGKAVAIKTFENNVTEEVLNYSEGDYFGELALIKDEPRAATVKALIDSKFLSLDRMSFKRLLGPLLALLKKNSELYQKFSKEIYNK